MRLKDKVFYSLADPGRRSILQMLCEKEMTVNSIAEKFNISRPAVSKHLKILYNSDLVKQRQSGRERYYSINPRPLNEIYKWLEYFDRFWDKKLNSLKNHLENEN